MAIHNSLEKVIAIALFIHFKMLVDLAERACVVYKYVSQ